MVVVVVAKNRKGEKHAHFQPFLPSVKAARASDYAFGQFRFLARLILVHGHWCYNRIAYTLQYFFYKDVVFILPALFFGFYSAFSAEPIYDSWTLLFWNLAFSALPILIFGTFEKDMDANMLLAYSGLHKALARNAMLTFREFGLWTILGIWQAMVAFFGVILCFSDDGVVMDADETRERKERERKKERK
jgi:phospholipid-translocating ATPase